MPCPAVPEDPHRWVAHEGVGVGGRVSKREWKGSKREKGVGGRRGSKREGVRGRRGVRRR